MTEVHGAMSIEDLVHKKSGKNVILIGEDHCQSYKLSSSKLSVPMYIQQLHNIGYNVWLELDSTENLAKKGYVNACKTCIGSVHIRNILSDSSLNKNRVKFVNTRNFLFRTNSKKIKLSEKSKYLVNKMLGSKHMSLQSKIYHDAGHLPVVYFNPDIPESLISRAKHRFMNNIKNEQNPALSKLYNLHIKKRLQNYSDLWKKEYVEKKKSPSAPSKSESLISLMKSKKMAKLNTLTNKNMLVRDMKQKLSITDKNIGEFLMEALYLFSHLMDINILKEIHKTKNNTVILVGDHHINAIVDALIFSGEYAHKHKNSKTMQDRYIPAFNPKSCIK